MNGALLYPHQFKGVIFDWDGVIAETRLDFSDIRRRFFGGKRAPLLEGAKTLSEEEAAALMKAIRDEEMRGAAMSTPVEGAFALIAFLDGRHVPWCVMSRNCRESIDVAAASVGFKLPPLVWGREARHVKPDRRAFDDAAAAMGVDVRSCLVIGDFLYELIGARRAGARCVLVNRADEECASYADARFARLVDFSAAFAADEPFVPWEYRAAVEKDGRETLEAMHRATALCDGALDARSLIQLEALASRGLGRVCVPEGREVSASEVARSPGLSPRWLKTPLSEALKSLFGERYPLLRVEIGSDGVPLFSPSWGV